MPACRIICRCVVQPTQAISQPGGGGGGNQAVLIDSAGGIVMILAEYHSSSLNYQASAKLILFGFHRSYSYFQQVSLHISSIWHVCKLNEWGTSTTLHIYIFEVATITHFSVLQHLCVVLYRDHLTDDMKRCPCAGVRKCGRGTVDPDRQLQEIIHNFTKKRDISFILGLNERSGIGDLGQQHQITLLTYKAAQFKVN